MMLRLTAVLFPTAAVLAAAGLIGCGYECGWDATRYLLPAARTVALITAATAYTAALFH